ncbi:MAG: hypothetical protein HOP95_06175 [Sphingomonas sp.]|nr:hypothetical protein [Sphingomonas sp.]
MSQSLAPLSKMFVMKAGKSAGTKDYTPGPVPFVTSSELNNGVIGYVEPFETDRVFQGPALAISGLGHATVHLSEFLPKGNGGDSLTVLTPKEQMTPMELIACAAAFNVLHGWRFSFGRKCSIGRLQKLEIPEPPKDLRSDVSADAKILASMMETFVDQLALGIAAQPQ